MKNVILLVSAISAFSINAKAADSAPVQMIKEMGLSEYTCQYKIPATTERRFNTSEAATIYAADKKTAYSICLSRIGAQVLGNDGELVLMASNTKIAPNTLVPITAVLLVRTK